MLSSVILDVSETGAAGSVTPNLYLGSTSPRLEASSWATIRLLLPLTRGLVVAAIRLEGAASRDDTCFTSTLSTNRARHRVASSGVGVATLRSDMAWLSSSPPFVGVEGSAMAWRPFHIDARVSAAGTASATSAGLDGGGMPCTGNEGGRSIVT
jgi:hypothetical protein